jgi:hypothetical protein
LTGLDREISVWRVTGSWRGVSIDLAQKGSKCPAQQSRNQKRCFGQEEQDLQDKARTKPLSFCSFGILFILFILSISFRK